MYKFTITLLLLTAFAFTGYAQKDSLSRADKAALDSMLKNDAFLSLMKDVKKNSLDVTIGEGNGSFSAHNHAVNATGITNQVIFTPAVVYHTKGGFSVGVTGYVSSDSDGLSLYQTGINGAYDYLGKKVNAGISYTRYLSDQNKYNSKSLYQNDFYSYLKKAKGIIQPGLELGYTSGRYKEIDLVKYRRPVIMDTVLVKDSTDNKASFFTVTASIEHDFTFHKVFFHEDELDMVPSLMLNAGNDKNTSTTTNKLYEKLLAKSKRQRITPTDKFQVQSVGASMEITYSVGKFLFEPNVYFDYYLPSTTSTRLSTIYSITAGFSF
jgi:hypothetical protein